MTSIYEFTKAYRKQLETGVKNTCRVVSRDIIRGTPVLTGALRASWTPAVGGAFRFRRSQPGSGGKANSRSDISGTISRMKIGDTYTMSNDQPYVARIEYEGWSAQAKGGMRAPVVMKWQSSVIDAFRAA